jgi:hypothetical protein
MGSLSAMARGSADRYFQEGGGSLSKLVPLAGVRRTYFAVARISSLMVLRNRSPAWRAILGAPEGAPSPQRQINGSDST